MTELEQRSERVDETVRSLWPAEATGVALVAVGGYGRRELFPYSDVDLLSVTPRHDLKDVLAPFLRALWDSGLRVSHSVHSVVELGSLDDRNVELSVSLLDRRFLAGDRGLFDAIRVPPKAQLAQALTKLARDRHSRQGGTIYHLEPNIKEAPGGLRDLQAIHWLGQLMEGVPEALPGHDLLFRLRLALHEAARRDQNVLDYAMQDACAAQFGFASGEELMRAYFREALPIYRACLRRMEAEESRRSPLFKSFLDRSARFSNSDFSVVRGQVYFRVPPADPKLPLQLFGLVARHGLPLSADAEARLRTVPMEPARWDDFRGVLEMAHPAHALRAMFDSGYINRLFPEMAGIDSLVIRDYYHRYTVDEHTLVAIETAVRLRQEEGRFAELARETGDYPLLLMALLFHDSGKGAPGEDHSTESERIAMRALSGMGMKAADLETVLYLIRRHLEMSKLMQTRDLSDPATAEALANSVGTIERLQLLTLLTYADISAVHPGALTPWRGTLLWRLYSATARRLTRALHGAPAAEGLPERYALTHSPEEIDLHHRMEAEHRTTHLKRDGHTQTLTVVAPDRPALFAQIAGALAGFGMNILRAEAFINERGVTIDSFTFADPMRTLELNPSETDRLESVVRDVIAGRRDAEDLLRGRPAPRRTEGAPEPRVSYDTEASTRATLFEITAADRPGLLHDLCKRIADAGCNIEVVLVHTEGRKAIDVFYVTRERQPLPEPTARRLREDLLGCMAGRINPGG